MLFVLAIGFEADATWAWLEGDEDDDRDDQDDDQVADGSHVARSFLRRDVGAE